MIPFLFAMWEQGWVPLPLCFPAAARFLEAGGFSFEILNLVGQLFTIPTKSSLVAASLEFLATICLSTSFSLIVAAASLLKYPSRAFMPTSSPPLFVSTSLVLRTFSAAFAVPNLSDPSVACDFTRALACALL